MLTRGSEATIHDIARRLNVSATTVWRAINNRPRVSQETRKRVLSEVKRLGYRPSLVAQNLSLGRTQTLGVVIPTIEDPTHAALVRAAEQTAFEHDFSLILCDTNCDQNREQRYLDLLSRRRVEGVLVVPFPREANPEEYLRLVQAGIAVVVMQRKLLGSDLPQVVPDDFGAARDLTRHLINLGHRTIAFLHSGIPAWNVSMNDRLKGYEKALIDAGQKVNSRCVLQVGSAEADGSGDSELDTARLEALLLRKNAPTALLIPTDVLALKVMAWLRSTGRRIPEDIAVTGFDDIQMSAFAEPPLTTVQHPAEEVGQRAASLMFEILAGKASATKSVIHSVACSLIVRKSCGMPRSGVASRRRAAVSSS